MTALAVVAICAAYLVRGVAPPHLPQRSPRHRLQPDGAADRAPEGSADRHEAVPALAGDPRCSTSSSSASLVGIGFLVVPPLVGQAQAAPDSSCRTMLDRAPGSSCVAKGILDHPISWQRRRSAKRRLPAARCRGHRASARSPASPAASFGFLTILILTFYLPARSASSCATGCCALFPAQRRRTRCRRCAGHHREGERWLDRPAPARRASSASRTALGLWLMGIPFFYVLALISGDRRADPGRRPDPRGDAGGCRRRHHLVRARRSSS